MIAIQSKVIHPVVTNMFYPDGYSYRPRAWEEFNDTLIRYADIGENALRRSMSLWD